MKTSTKFFVIALVFVIISFFLGKIIWPDTGALDIMLSGIIWPDTGFTAIPTNTQMFLFILLAVLESVAFGVGVAFALLGWKSVKAVMSENKSGAIWSFVSITWLLVSWWAHDNMHRVNAHDNLAGLLKIEYLFHFTLIIAGFILAYNFWKMTARQA